jgi:nitrogen fixation protein FixH
MSPKTTSAKHRSPLTGRHVLMMMLGFFGFIFLVNGIFMYFALESWPGLGTPDAYRKGIAYNDTLKAAERQNELGWRGETAFIAAGKQSGRLQVAIRDDQNRDVAGLTVTARLTRPTHGGYDRTVALSPGAENRYQADVSLPLPGRWHMNLEAGRNGRIHYRIEHELMIQ